MESKKELLRVGKLKKMLADANKRNEAIIVKLCNDLLPSVDVEGLTNEMFDLIVLKKIHSLAENATTLLKKKEQRIAEQEIYCISLLSFCFFDKLIEVSIEKKKVKIVDKRF